MDDQSKREHPPYGKLAEVSVVIPTQQRPALLREAVHSVLTQTFANLEVIIVPNAATTETIDAAEEIRRADRRVRVVVLLMPVGNISAARNAGIAAAKGDWIAFLDDDDLWLPHKLERQLQFARQTGADMVNCDFVDFPITMPHVPVAQLQKMNLAEVLMLDNHTPAGSSGAVVRADVMRSLGGFDRRMRCCEDWDMWRRIASRYRVRYLNEVLVRITRREDDSRSRIRGLLRWMIWALFHYGKMPWDTPSELRHMLPRVAKRAAFLPVLCTYVSLNDLTGGHFKRCGTQSARSQKPVLAPAGAAAPVPNAGRALGRSWGGRAAKAATALVWAGPRQPPPERAGPRTFPELSGAVRYRAGRRDASQNWAFVQDRHNK